MNKKPFLLNKSNIIFAMLLLAIVIFSVTHKTNYSSPVASETQLSYTDIATAIKTKYDRELDNFKSYRTSHYAARVYRISGNTSYLDHNLQDLGNMQRSVKSFLQIAYDNGEAAYSKVRVNKRDSEARSDPRREVRLGLRRESLAISPKFKYYLDSLNVLRRALEYRVCSLQFEKMKQHVLTYDYTHDLSNPLMIEAWAAQFANAVVWIKQLGGKDYSDVFINALHEVYPENKDHLLSEQQYENKLYGFTHVILAESQYYQYKINRDDFAWIFDYFDKNIDTIVSRAKADVIAEVGITYLLAGDYHSPALEKTKRAIAQQFDRTHHMIPSIKGTFDIPTGSHRNILAIMLLSAPQQLYPGPWLNQLPHIAQLPEDMYSCIPLQSAQFYSEQFRQTALHNEHLNFTRLTSDKLYQDMDVVKDTENSRINQDNN